MKVNVRLLALYVFILAISYLAGAYFGSYLQVIFIFFVILPPVSVLIAAVGAVGLRFDHYFSSDMPVKGSKLEYWVMIKNPTFLPVVNVSGAFTSRLPGSGERVEKLQLYLAPRSTVEKHFLFTCPYCGMYDLNYDKFEIRDLLHLVAFRRSMPSTSIYVYPRILPLGGFAGVVEDIKGIGSTQSPDGMTDSSLFLQLREYRDGESIRHISWKKYAATGRPFLKDYDKTRKLGVRIYLDLRRDFTRNVDRLEQQDVSLETLVALVKYFLDRSVSTDIAASGLSGYAFHGESPLQFQEFYDGTPELHFAERTSPLEAIRKDEPDATGYAVILITHMDDHELLSYPERSGKDDMKVIINAAGRKSAAETDRFPPDIASRYGGELYLIEDSDSIRSVLENHVYTNV